MTWISLIGIALGVAALIVTLAVRTGFREEFVDTILGANAHVAVQWWLLLRRAGQHLPSQRRQFFDQAGRRNLLPGWKYVELQLIR